MSVEKEKVVSKTDSVSAVAHQSYSVLQGGDTVGEVISHRVGFKDSETGAFLKYTEGGFVYDGPVTEFATCSNSEYFINSGFDSLSPEMSVVVPVEGTDKYAFRNVNPVIFVEVDSDSFLEPVLYPVELKESISVPEFESSDKFFTSGLFALTDAVHIWDSDESDSISVTEDLTGTLLAWIRRVTGQDNQTSGLMIMAISMISVLLSLVLGPLSIYIPFSISVLCLTGMMWAMVQSERDEYSSTLYSGKRASEVSKHVSQTSHVETESQSVVETVSVDTVGENVQLSPVDSEVVWTLPKENGLLTRKSIAFLSDIGFNELEDESTCEVIVSESTQQEGESSVKLSDGTVLTSLDA